TPDRSRPAEPHRSQRAAEDPRSDRPQPVSIRVGLEDDLLMARFIVVPQWQGSRSTRAMALIDGADAIEGDLPSSSCHRGEVPYEAGESLETGVHRASTLRRIAAHLSEELEGIAAADHLVVVGGDGGVAVPAIGHVAGDDLAVVWFDAHAPLASP